jgi:hypothetical protein
MRFFGSGLHVDKIQLNRGVRPQQSSVTEARHPYGVTSMPPYGVAAGLGANARVPFGVQFFVGGTKSHGLAGNGVGGGGRQLA